MGAPQLLLQLAGNVVLLLWGLHMVQSGLVRAFGGELRRWIDLGLRNRASAFAAGLGVTILLQSSTATGLMVASFAAAGAMALTPALAAMLGANVGSTLIVLVLAFDVTRIAPLFLLAGFFAFRRSNTRFHDLGRVAIGLGLMLLALHLMLGAVGAVESAPGLRRVLGLMTADAALAAGFAAAIAWAAHSSVAAVLLIASLAGGGIVGPEAAVAMVAGANLGSALNPLLEGPRGNPAARRMPVGNFVNRLVGAAVAVPLAAPIAAELAALSPDPAQRVALFHFGFNLALAVLFILPLRWIARALARLLPEGPSVADPAAPRYLDPQALGMPHVAVANAAREALRMADTAGAMIEGALRVLRTDDRRRIREIRAMDDVLDRLHDAIKRYLTGIAVEGLETADARRLADVLAFAINLEHVGDIVDRNLMEAARRKIRRKLKFSREGAADLIGILERLKRTQELAAAVFVSGDRRAARTLMKEKEIVRGLEARATEAHFSRLRAGRSESVETSALHLDILRDLRRINAHLVTAAYPVLDRSGELLPSRVKEI